MRAVPHLFVEPARGASMRAISGSAPASLEESANGVRRDDHHNDVRYKDKGDQNTQFGVTLVNILHL